MAARGERWKKWLRKLRNKYKLVILNDETYEERFSFRLSRWNVLIALSTLSLVLIILTTVLIAFTPLREYIPGYTDMSMYRKIDEIERKTDSLERDFQWKSQYLENIQRILTGNDTLGESMTADSQVRNYSDISISHSKEDSMMRVDYEYQSMYNLNPGQKMSTMAVSEPSISSYNFFTPLNGIVTSAFDPEKNHLGIDIVSKTNEAVKSTLDGIVIFADWTLETGYVVGIQHPFNIVSVYKHNSTLLTHQGASVKAGEVIAIVGSSGTMTSGPHLHFEIWYNGTPVDPAKLMLF
jgi:murein DD-endopeptidase MepM/ murein hydrolase activator NlpD